MLPRFPSVLTLSLLLTFILTPTLRAQVEESEPVIESPELHADHRVTFRLEAPAADSVKIRGIQRGLVNLTKNGKGVWTVTLGPLAPGIYGYSFLIDGEASVDPSNPFLKPERSPETSLLEVTSSSPLPFQWHDVPHGTVRLHDYFSKPLERLRRLRVYTPPDYDSHPTKHYPVLYLFHGTGDTEATWTEFGRAHYILDTLIAAKKAVPMIIVMTDGHADLEDEEGIDLTNLVDFEKDLLQAVVPFVEKSYRIKSEPEHRAICGLSMGGMQSLFIGLRHPDFFSWVGGMSAWVPHLKQYCPNVLESPTLINKQLRLLWMQIGQEDVYLPEFKKFDAELENVGINREFRVTDGTHSWPVWRGYLADFAPLLFR